MGFRIEPPKHDHQQLWHKDGRQHNTDRERVWHHIRGPTHQLIAERMLAAFIDGKERDGTLISSAGYMCLLYQRMLVRVIAGMRFACRAMDHAG